MFWRTTDSSTRILGCKTIRFVGNALQEHDESFVRFVQNMFPCFKIVVNIRSDTNAQVKSRSMASHEAEEHARKKMKEENLISCELLWRSSLGIWPFSLTAPSGDQRH